MDQTLVVNRNPTSALVSRNFILKTLPVSLLAGSPSKHGVNGRMEKKSSVAALPAG